MPGNCATCGRTSPDQRLWMLSPERERPSPLPTTLCPSHAHCAHHTVPTTLCTPHSAHHTVHTTLYPPHCAHHTVHTTLCTPHCYSWLVCLGKGQGCGGVGQLDGVGGEATMYCQLFSPLPAASGCPLNTDRQMPLSTLLSATLSPCLYSVIHICVVLPATLAVGFSNPDMEL